MARSTVAVWLLLLGMACSAHEFRYIEAESYANGDGYGLREEGFTSWMAHPSHGQVMVLGGAGDWLSYDVRGLSEAPYHLFLRGLAWASGCEVDVYWDGVKVGRTSYEVPGTALKWSREIAAVSGAGDHELRLVGAEGITQAPYIDTTLLTTQEGFRPGDDDQDFESLVSPLPALRLAVDGGEWTIPPSPGGLPAAGDAPVIADIAAGPLVFGTSNVTVKLSGSGPYAIRCRIGEAGPAEARVQLRTGAQQEVTVSCEAARWGEEQLHVALLSGEQEVLAGEYHITVPDPVDVSMDEYAYPVGTPRATWTATLATSPEVARSLRATISLRSPANPAIATLTCDGQTPAVSREVEIGALPRGLYEVSTRFERNGQVVSDGVQELLVYEPAALDEWQAVTRTAARGDGLLLNGEPFLGQLLYHAAPDEPTRQQGFNMVQCYGGDPDPLPSIEDHLNRCRDAGLYGTVALFNNRYFCPDGAFDLEHIRGAVERFREHPALFGWDLVDEPEVSLTPEVVGQAAALIRRLDPNHVVWVNLCQVGRAGDYLASQDLWSFDCYPFPTIGLAGFLPWLDYSDGTLLGSHPMGTVLQTYSPNAPKTRMPTPQELRASAYLHIIHGYKWFGYYSYFDGPPAGCLARDPLLWSYCRALTGELRAMSSVILDPAPWRPVDTGTAPSVLQAAEKTVAGQRYLVAVNMTSAPAEVSLSVVGETASVLFEAERALPIVAGVLHDSLGPSAARVYRVGATSVAKAGASRLKSLLRGGP